MKKKRILYAYNISIDPESRLFENDFMIAVKHYLVISKLDMCNTVKHYPVTLSSHQFVRNVL